MEPRPVSLARHLGRKASHSSASRPVRLARCAGCLAVATVVAGLIAAGPSARLGAFALSGRCLRVQGSRGAETRLQAENKPVLKFEAKWASRRKLEDYDPNSKVDMAELGLLGTKLCLTSTLWGFPDFKSMIELKSNGNVTFYGGMTSKEDGLWNVLPGKPSNGESPLDLYLDFTQPLTDTYKELFLVEDKECLWRGKLEILGTGSSRAVRVEGGVILTEKTATDLMSKSGIVREGVFTAEEIGAEAIEEVLRKNKQAFERALNTPKAESTGFKTPARIAGVKRKSQLNLPAGKEDDEDEMPLLEDGYNKKKR